MDIKKLIDAHKFFVKESGPYVGKWSFKPYKKWYHPHRLYHGRYVYTLKQILYYPIAYIKFMRHYI